MTCFADSSALVKLYADEDGARSIRLLGLLVVSEIARAEVPAALWHKQRAGELDPSRPVITVCRSGGRSVDAVHILKAKGFTAVVSMADGMIDWARQSHPVVRGTR